MQQKMLLSLCLSLLFALLCKANGDVSEGYLVIEHIYNRPSLNGSYYEKMAEKLFSFSDESSSVYVSICPGKKNDQTEQAPDWLCVGYGGRDNAGICIGSFCSKVSFLYKEEAHALSKANIPADPRRGIAPLGDSLIVVVLSREQQNRAEDRRAKDLTVASALAQNQGSPSKEVIDKLLHPVDEDSKPIIVTLKYTKHPENVLKAAIGAIREPLLLFSTEKQSLNWEITKDSAPVYRFHNHRASLARHGGILEGDLDVSITFTGPSLARIKTNGGGLMVFRNGGCIHTLQSSRQKRSYLQVRRDYYQELPLQPDDILVLLNSQDSAAAEAKLNWILETAVASKTKRASTDVNYALVKVQAMIDDHAADLWRIREILSKLGQKQSFFSELSTKLVAVKEKLTKAGPGAFSSVFTVPPHRVAELERELGGPGWAKSYFDLLIQADKEISNLQKELFLLGYYGVKPQLLAMTNKHIAELKEVLIMTDAPSAILTKVLKMANIYTAKVEMALIMQYAKSKYKATVFSEDALDGMLAMTDQYVENLENELANDNVDLKKMLAIADKHASEFRIALGTVDHQDTALERPAVTGDFALDWESVLAMTNSCSKKATAVSNEISSYSLIELNYASHKIYAVSLTVVADGSKDQDSTTADKSREKRQRTGPADNNQMDLADGPRGKRQRTRPADNDQMDLT